MDSQDNVKLIEKSSIWPGPIHLRFQPKTSSQ